MARSAGEQERSYAPEIIRLLEMRPGRLEFALRLALICALTTLVAEIYQTPDPALTIYVVFFLNRADRTTSLILNLVFMVLISVIISIVLLVTMVALDDPMWRVASMASISFGVLFLVSASKLSAIGGIIALIVAYGLDTLGKVQLGEEATRALLYVWLFIGIPAGVSLLVNLLLAPAPRRLAERSIAIRLQLSAAMLRAPDERIRGRFRECLREGAGQIQTWLRLAATEKTATPDDVKALRQAADSTLVLLSAIDVMDRNVDARLPDMVRESLAQLLREMASILFAGGYPTDVTWDAPGEVTQLSPLAAQVRGDIEEALTRFAEPTADGAHAHEASKEAGGFFTKDAFTNPDHVHYALKTTAAAMFCYLLYSLLDWQTIHTCLITCYIVSLGTAAESVEKLTLRICGCLIGAAVGTATMIFLVPSLTSIGALMTLVFVGCLASAYVAAGSPRISYAGYQIAFAFLLCVVQGASPSFDMVTARDRSIGILLGNLVVYVLFTNLWPVSLSRRVDPAITALLERLATMLKAANAQARRAVASEAQAALGKLEADLDLIHYEPASIRPPDGWLSPRRVAAQELGALEGPLLLAANQGGALGAQIAGRLQRLAAPSADSEPAATMETGRDPSDGPLQRIIDAHLRTLENALLSETEDEGMASHAAA